MKAEMEESNNSTTINFDNIHLLLWLVKDTAWVMGFKNLALFMIIPTVSYTCYLLYKNYHDKNYFILYSAILCWLLGNSTWLLNDFLFDNKYNLVSYIFFFLGITITCIHIVKQKNIGK